PGAGDELFEIRDAIVVGITTGAVLTIGIVRVEAVSHFPFVGQPIAIRIAASWRSLSPRRRKGGAPIRRVGGVSKANALQRIAGAVGSLRPRELVIEREGEDRVVDSVL